MEWEQVWAILGVNAALFILSIGITITLWLWARSESRADTRMMLGLIDSIKQDAKEFQLTMARESKEFHGRLCAIEEKRKK